MIGSHIFQPTVQNAAELVEGVGADIPVFAQSVQLAGADFVFFDKFILRDAFFLHRLPKRFKRNHTKYHPILPLCN